MGRSPCRRQWPAGAPVRGVHDADFEYRAPGSPQPGVYYRNRSSIVFIDLAPAPTDPNYDRFGSLGLMHVIIEEASDVVKKARSVITSRKDRKLDREYGIPDKAVLTCNPSPNFVRAEFYQPYFDQGGDELQTWNYDNDAGAPI